MQLSHSWYVLLSSKAAKIELFPWQIPPTREITHHSWNCDFITTKQQSQPKRLEVQRCSFCSHSDIRTKPQALQCHRGWCWPGFLQTLQKLVLLRSTAGLTKSIYQPSTIRRQLFSSGVTVHFFITDMLLSVCDAGLLTAHIARPLRLCRACTKTHNKLQNKVIT